MRKILSLLGAMALSTTASASITACDNSDRPSTQKIDLNDVPSKVDLTGVSKNIKSDFGIKLINKIKELKPEFSKLEKSDIGFTKVDGSELKSSDIITNPKLEIKISTSSNNKNFTGYKDIEVNLTVTKTDLFFLPKQLNVTQVTANNVNSFVQRLLTVIENQQGFGSFDRQADVYKKGTTDSLEPSDIVSNPKLEITVIEKNTSSNFKGQKDIEVNLTVEKTNLSTITQLTGLHLVADNTKKFRDFNSEILNSNEFKNKKATVDDYIINFYFNNKGNNLNETTQYPNNDIFVEIEATQNNSYWTGNTNLIQIEVFDS